MNKDISCHECEYWLPDEDMCEYAGMPPCMDYLYEKDRKKAFENERNKTK